MEHLDWEHGRAPHLRAAITQTLSELVDKVDDRTRSFSFAIGVRFRRSATADDPEMPPDYLYKIDVAHLRAEPSLVGSMLASRRPNAEMHYDILRVQVLLPVPLAALALVRPDLHDIPMCLLLMQDEKTPTTSEGPATNENELAQLNQYEVVRRTMVRPQLTNGSEVIEALIVDVGLQRGWVPRPPRLLAAFGLRSALAMALDADTSPCAPLAAYYRMRDNQRVGEAVTPVVWYEGVEESALPVEIGDQSCSLRVQVASGKPFVFAGPIPPESAANTTLPDNASHYFYFASSKGLSDQIAKTLAAKFSLMEVVVGGPYFKVDQTLTIQDRSLVMFTSGKSAPTDEEQLKLILTAVKDLQDLLAGVRRGRMPNMPRPGTAPAPHHLMLARDRTIAETLFPPPVVEQLRAATVGAWCYKLFVEGAEKNPFWMGYCQALASRFSAYKADAYIRALVEINSSKVKTPLLKVKGLVQFENMPELFDETAQLDRTLMELVLPAAGVYARTQREIDLLN